MFLPRAVLPHSDAIRLAARRAVRQGLRCVRPGPGLVHGLPFRVRPALGRLRVLEGEGDGLHLAAPAPHEAEGWEGRVPAPVLRTVAIAAPHG